MIVATVLTVIYQFLLNGAFGPLFRYLPITLEDDAVARDEEFARAQQKRWNIGGEEEDEGQDLNDVLEEQERREREADRTDEEIEMKSIEERKLLKKEEPLVKIPYYLSPRWLTIDPNFASLRSNPRFQRLVTRAN